MLYVILFSFSFLCIFVNRLVLDKLSRRIILSFLMIWFISLSISTFNLYDLYPVSIETYTIMLINILGFVLGFVSVKIEKSKFINSGNDLLSGDIASLLNSRSFFVFFVCGIILVYSFLRNYFTEMTYSAFDRVESVELSILGSNKIVALFFMYLAAPLFYFANAILAYSLIFYRKFFISILLYLYIIIFALIGGGRTAFIVIFIALCLVLFLGSNYKIRKLIAPIAVLFLLVYVIMSYLTAIREGILDLDWYAFETGSDILNKHFVTYVTLPFRLFDYALNHDYLHKLGGYYWGLSSFDGINLYMSIFLRFFSIDLDQISLKTTAYLQDTWIAVGRDDVANYAYTNAIYHYLDFGVIGVFIIPFLFSRLVRLVIRELYIHKSIFALALLFYLYFVMVHSVFSWHLNKLYSLPYIVLMCLVVFKNRYRFI